MVSASARGGRTATQRPLAVEVGTWTSARTKLSASGSSSCCGHSRTSTCLRSSSSPAAWSQHLPGRPRRHRLRHHHRRTPRRPSRHHHHRRRPSACGHQRRSRRRSGHRAPDLRRAHDHRRDHERDHRRDHERLRHEAMETETETGRASSGPRPRVCSARPLTLHPRGSLRTYCPAHWHWPPSPANSRGTPGDGRPASHKMPIAVARAARQRPLRYRRPPPTPGY